MLSVAEMRGGGLFEMLLSACILQNQGFFGSKILKNTYNLLGIFKEIKSRVK